ncbi:MAG: hypothetical protein F6K19_44665 [Cyanothece sp. SIO1E1]|nr:hypothetical protein [Cyanothece sp. SIO1E1]
MSRRKRTVQLTETIWRSLEALLDSGEFANHDDAANYYLQAALKGQNGPKQSVSEPINESTHQYPPSTTPVTASEGPKETQDGQGETTPNFFELMQKS